MDITQGKYRPIELLRYAGLFLWFCAGIPLLMMRWIYPEPLPLELYIGWFMLHGLFGLMYWNLVQYLPEHTTISHRLLYLSVLTVSALGISVVSQSTMGGIMLLIVAVVLPWMLSIVAAVGWLVAQYVLLAITVSRMPGFSLNDASLQAALHFGGGLPMIRCTSYFRLQTNSCLSRLMNCSALSTVRAA